MTAQILKITTPFNSRLYWTGSILSENIADAVMVTDNTRIAWHDKCDAKAMDRARDHFAAQFTDSIVEIINI
jgi:hypothetical protein